MLAPRQAESGSSNNLVLLMTVEILPALNSALAAEMFLYGLHAALFFLCVYILLKHRPALHFPILISVTIMFVLATADVAISLRLMLKDLPAVFRGKTSIFTAMQRIYPKNPLFVTNNLIADLLLIYRCYVVWGRRRLIVVVSVLLLTADTIWGWIGAGVPARMIQTKFTDAYIWSVLAMNVIMTALTAGRIWWLGWRTQAIAGKGHLRIYNTATAILVETGLLYSITIIIVAFSGPLHGTFRMTMMAIVYRVVAIMPTLMIVQVGLGRQFHSDGVETDTQKETIGSTILTSTRPTTRGADVELSREGMSEEHPGSPEGANQNRVQETSG